jgi:hypothetical protein
MKSIVDMICQSFYFMWEIYIYQTIKVVDVVQRVRNVWSQVTFFDFLIVKSHCVVEIFKCAGENSLDKHTFYCHA